VDSEEEDEKEKIEKVEEKKKELERKKKQIERGLEKRKMEELKKKDLGASRAIEKKVEYNAELITRKLKEIVENRFYFLSFFSLHIIQIILK
jgi:hypothetical protein